MACSYPITIIREGRHVLVPCNRCINCIQRKRSEWSFRLLQELKTSEKATFLTLTYNDDTVPKNQQLQKKKLQNYFKRVRVTQKAIKYYAVGEYGSKNKRPHYHAIVFNADNNILANEWRECGNDTQKSDKPTGYIKCDVVNEATIHYVTGYITEKYGKMDERTGKQIDTWQETDIRPFALMSKGLGKIYLKHAAKYHKSNFTTTTISEGGIKGNLPRYYRDKIFNEEERKNLAEQNQQKFFHNRGTNESEFERRIYQKLIVKNQLNKKQL